MAEISATITALGTLFAAIGALIAAIGALWLAYRNSQKAADTRAKAAAAEHEAAAAKQEAADAKRAIVKVGDDLFLVGKAIDGRLSELLELTRTAALAEGKLAGAAEQKATEAGEQ